MPEVVGKQFSVVNIEDSHREIRLTLGTVTENRWKAVDPRGIIDPDEGPWRSNNVNTECLPDDGGPYVINLIGCGFANVQVGATVVADVRQAQGETFRWTCKKHIKGL